MGVNDIAFPHMGIYLENVPKNITIFGFSIAFYGMIIALGMILGILLAAKIAKKYGYDENIIWDFAIYGIVFGVIGARIYYVIFSWDLYKDNLLSIFNLRQGGMAVYGSVIAAFVTLAIYVRIKKIHYLTMADICVPGLALGQAVGRWGNFFNREVFGEYTDNIFAMQLPTQAVRAGDISASIEAHMTAGSNVIQVHPTFLYECLWNLALVALMLVLWQYKKFEGEISLAYLGGYGLGRAWIEGIRTDTLFIPGTTLAVSQVLAIILFVFSIVVAAFAFAKVKKKKGETVLIKDLKMDESGAEEASLSKEE